MDRKSPRGISLGEFMIAVAIAGVLAAAALPSLIRFVQPRATGGAALDLRRFAGEVAPSFDPSARRATP